MTYIIQRAEAIQLVSFCKLLSLSEAEYLDLSDTVLAELETDFLPEEELNSQIRLYIIHDLDFVRNDYLQSIVNIFFPGHLTLVEGEEPVMYPCACCGFKSLNIKGEYQICEVCFWEDDGSDELKRYSSVNSMTLEEGKANFKKLGVISERYKQSLTADRMGKYYP